ncbi:hypothetical protein F443_16903 [Phytophthora nicotianae P1569]|nr:hypothetical protein F443_16903 [Phytophthora nicotianae P1569]ETO65811.1 hypothetical protein F444_16926 [Phytophthora nicotianae P1976]
MELVAATFSHSIQYAIEERGALSFNQGAFKYEAVFNMDQTAINIDMNGKTTIDFVGTQTVDVLQGSEADGFRCSVFLTASVTGVKLPPLIVYAGIPGGISGCLESLIRKFCLRTYSTEEGFLQRSCDA